MRQVSAEYYARYYGEPDLVFTFREGKVFAEDVPLPSEPTAEEIAAEQRARYGGWDDFDNECSHGHANCTRH